MAPKLWHPRGIIWMGAWKTLHPRLILHTPGAISEQGGVSPGESRTRALRSGAECLSDLPTAGHQFFEEARDISKYTGWL